MGVKGTAGLGAARPRERGACDCAARIPGAPAPKPAIHALRAGAQARQTVSENQRWDPERYRRIAGFVSELGAPLLELLDARPGERILDLGCGDGALTQQLLARGCEVVGIDSSAEQVAAARARGVDARIGRAESLAFREAFDGVLSNATLHWVPDAGAVLDGVYRALRPGGRFVAELGGAGNVAGVVSALELALKRRGIDPRALNPWYFPGADEYAALLGARGFQVRSIRLFARPTPIDSGLGEWLGVFAQSFLSAAPADEREDLVREVCDAAAPRLQRADGAWVVDYVRLRVAALRPAG